MIRDASDYSVKAKIDLAKEEAKKPAGPAMDHDGTRKFMTGQLPHQTGLPLEKGQSDCLARLNRSRDWLSRYRTDPEKTAREMGETGE